VSVRAAVIALAVFASYLAAQPHAQTAAALPCPRCAWIRPETDRTIAVSTVGDLHNAVISATPGTTVLLADGEYRLERMLDIAVPRVVIRSQSLDPTRVVLRGDGMMEQRVGVAISISAPDVTIADLTVGHVGFHGIQVRGERGASRATIHNVRIVDTGQQLLKGSTAGGPLYADDGVVSCSTLEYTNHAPTDYTNGIDVLGGKNWTVRNNILRRIRGPAERGWAAGPAILFWANSQFTNIDGNVVVDSFRGIALGLGPGASGRLARDGEQLLDHTGGWVRNNVVVNSSRWADEGIEASAAADVRIENNTVLVEGRLPWSISVRFRSSHGIVQHNYTSRGVTLRDGAQATVLGNVEAQ
jgi:hypothetical protein